MTYRYVYHIAGTVQTDHRFSLIYGTVQTFLTWSLWRSINILKLTRIRLNTLVSRPFVTLIKQIRIITQQWKVNDIVRRLLRKHKLKTQIPKH